MLKNFLLTIFSIILFSTTSNADRLDEIFFIGKMESHNKNFTLFFKTREKAILAKGEKYNYITDYPQDLYIYDNKTEKSYPLISYEWFPTHVKFFLDDYNFPVFPEDFAYYLLKDNNTLIMISAVKSFNKNFRFDIDKKKLNLYPSDGKFDFIISSIVKNCGHSELNENYKCNYYKPLISNNLIN
ncbi:hypothetical protein OAH88_03510 [Candidatus Pelagibacter sp.]|jgi:hypothetical protein|nr:hypothetical protein [Candidatus Pelagibacter sp.]